MYCRYGENKSWGFECLSQSTSETGGFKEVVFVFKGEDAWSKMRFESGVIVYKEFPLQKLVGDSYIYCHSCCSARSQEVEILIDPQDLEISVCRASGPGGQGVNTTDSAVQILHKPSGIQVYCADERSQLKNKNKAMTVLRSRLFKLSKRRRCQVCKRPKKSSWFGDRSERIRTYNFPKAG